MADMGLETWIPSRYALLLVVDGQVLCARVKAAAPGSFSLSTMINSPATWINTHVYSCPGNSLATSDVYEAYLRSLASGEYAESRIEFGRAMSRSGYRSKCKKIKGKSVRCFRDIELREVER